MWTYHVTAAALLFTLPQVQGHDSGSEVKYQLLIEYERGSTLESRISYSDSIEEADEFSIEEFFEGSSPVNARASTESFEMLTEDRLFEVRDGLPTAVLRDFKKVYSSHKSGDGPPLTNHGALQGCLLHLERDEHDLVKAEVHSRDKPLDAEEFLNHRMLPIPVLFLPEHEVTLGATWKLPASKALQFFSFDPQRRMGVQALRGTYPAALEPLSLDKGELVVAVAFDGLGRYRGVDCYLLSFEASATHPKSPLSDEQLTWEDSQEPPMTLESAQSSFRTTRKGQLWVSVERGMSCWLAYEEQLVFELEAEALWRGTAMGFKISRDVQRKAELQYRTMPSPKLSQVATD